MATRKAPATQQVAAKMPPAKSPPAKTPARKPARTATTSIPDDEKGGKGGPVGIFSNTKKPR